MNKSPIFNFVEVLLGPPERKHAVPVQLAFRWEQGINAGMLSRTDVEGVYSLTSEATSGAHAPQGAGVPLVVEQLFEAEVISRVMVVSEKKPGIIEVV